MENIKGNETYHIKILDKMRIYTLNKGDTLWKSVLKKYGRKSIFTYNLFPNNKICKNIVWFANKNKAEYYKKKDSEIYSYITRIPLNLFLVNNYNNYHLFSSFISRNIKKMKCLTELTIDHIGNDKFKKYKYLSLNKEERVLYEYRFAFGLMNVSEQFEFLKLILKLQEYKIVPIFNNIMSDKVKTFDQLRTNRQLLNIFKGLFYFVKNWSGQRLSIYHIDINVAHNLCISLPKNINGYVYFHEPSIWHYKMKDTSEIAIFDTKKVLV